MAYCDGDVVRVLDWKTGKQVSTFEKHTSEVVSLAYTPEGKYLMSGAHDKTVRLWDATTGIQVLEYGDAIYNIDVVAISPDGRFAAVVRYDKVIRLLSLRTVGDRQAGATIANPSQAPDSRTVDYRFIELTIDRDGSGKIVADTRQVDQIDRDISEKPGTAVQGLDGLKNAEITRLKDGRFRVIHDFQKIRDIDDLKSPFNNIDKAQHQIDTDSGVLVLTAVPQQGYKLAKLWYPRQLRLPLQVRYLIVDFIEDGIIGVNLRWPNSGFAVNLHGTTPDKRNPRRIEAGLLPDLDLKQA